MLLYKADQHAVLLSYVSHIDYQISYEKDTVLTQAP